MPRTTILLTTLLAWAAASVACAPVRSASHELGAAEGGPVIEPRELAERVIDAPDIRASVEFLATEDLGGRGTGSEGLQRSAAWVAEQFRLAGLEPAGDHGGFLQYWPWATVGPDSTVRLPNVVARLPGSSLPAADEYIIVMAHFDGPGVGEPDASGDSIYNAADDNASGVAALIEVAQAFGALPTPPERPLVFLATSGGEHGMAGAAWFADHPTVALYGAVAVLDLDTVGRSSPDSLFVVGDRASGLGRLVTETAAASGWTGLAPMAAVEEGQAPGEDRLPFARRGIPSVRLHSGVRKEHGTPSDEAELVDADKVARVARLVFPTAYGLATRDRPPAETGSGGPIP